VASSRQEQLAIYREVILERPRRITRSLSKAQAKQSAPAAAIEPVEPAERRSRNRPTESESKQATPAAVGIPEIMAVNVPTWEFPTSFKKVETIKKFNGEADKLEDFATSVDAYIYVRDIPLKFAGWVRPDPEGGWIHCPLPNS
jgi:hypothetical protein